MDFIAIRTALKSIAPLSPWQGVFGAQTHRFQIPPTLSKSELEYFEREHRISLPQDYRGLLTNVGNDAPGPYYGLFELGEMDHGHGYRDWKENDGFIGSLSMPFPHVDAWNDLTGMPVFDEDAPDPDFALEEAHGRAMDVWERDYWSSDQINGAIPLCHLGCNLREWLIVTGPEAGNVWADLRSDHQGLKPLSRDQRPRVTFAEWYCDWLNSVLSQLDLGMTV